jgi:hypothetical protein
MPTYTFGSTADRNSMVVRDLSGLEPAVRAAAPERAAPAVSGGDRRAALVGGVTLAAAVAAERWLALHPHRDPVS